MLKESRLPLKDRNIFELGLSCQSLLLSDRYQSEGSSYHAKADLFFSESARNFTRLARDILTMGRTKRCFVGNETGGV